MPGADVRNRVRALFAAKEGAELVDAIADEICDLHAHVDRIAEQLRLLPLYQSFSERMDLLEEAGVGQVQLPQRLTIEASHLFVTDHGFYTLEYDSSGRAYRWTGPRRDFYFVVYVDRSVPLRLELEIFRMVDRRLQSDIVLLADGVPMPLHLDTARDCIVGRAVLPVHSRTRATSLIFVVPCVLPEPKGLDARHLGVAFRELRIRPDGPDAHAAMPTDQSAHESSLTTEWLMSSDPSHISAPKLAATANAQTTRRSNGIDRFSAGEGEGPLPRVARIDARQIENGTAGFFPMEVGRDGHSYRWTGPGRTFALTVRVDRSQPLLVRLCLVRFVDRPSQTPMTLAVDGVVRDLELNGEADGIIAHVTIPARSSEGPTTLLFAVSAVVSPGDADRRLLGVAFRYLAVEPTPQFHRFHRLIESVRRKAFRRLSVLLRDGGSSRNAVDRNAPPATP